MKWYAVYTRSRFEKKVKLLLEEKGIEVFLPLVKSWRRWSDRMKKIEKPLINSYVFVKTEASQQDHYYSILNTPGVVGFIRFEGKLVPIPPPQIDALRRVSEHDFEVEALEHPLPPGTPVEVKYGPLKGVKGEVLRRGGKNFLIIQLEVINKSIQVKLPEGMIEISED